MNPNHDLPPISPYKSMFEYPEREMVSMLSELLGTEVLPSSSSNYELKKSSFSCVSRLDFNIVFELANCNVQQIFENCELHFTSDEFQRKVCADITIAQTVFYQLRKEFKSGELVDFDIKNVFEVFPNLITTGISGKEILDFFRERGQYPIIKSLFLEELASGRLEYKLSFACKAMNIKNEYKLRNEVSMYSQFFENGLATFCASEKVLVNEEKNLSYNFTFWRKNMFLHVHNKSIFSAASGTLEKTNQALLLMHERFFHGDLHFHNIATTEDFEEFEENILLYDLISAYVIKSFANLGESILPDVIVYLGSLTSSFNLLFEEGVIGVDDAMHTIKVMQEYKEGLKKLCLNQPNALFRMDNNIIKQLEIEVEAFIENVRYFLNQIN